MSEVVIDSVAVHSKLAKISKTWNKVSTFCHARGRCGEACEVVAPLKHSSNHLLPSHPDRYDQILTNPLFLRQVYQEKENASSPAPDALLVVMGKVREDPIRIQSVDFL